MCSCTSVGNAWLSRQMLRSAHASWPTVDSAWLKFSQDTITTKAGGTA